MQSKKTPSMDNEASRGLSSALYSGWVRHRRFTPIKHAFKYPMFMFYLDLDELSEVFKGKWYASIERFNFVRYCRKDYFKPEKVCLKAAIIEEVEAYFKQYQITSNPIVKVRMLTHLRLFNFTFNPVTFYYCFDENADLIAILAEITNTPWDEKHHYVLPVTSTVKDGHPDMDDSFESDPYLYRLKGNNKHCFDFNKSFHVSPFNPMHMRYHWVFSVPEQLLRVHMDNHLNADGDGNCLLSEQVDRFQEKHFDATLMLERKSISDHLAYQLIRQPLMTVKVVIGIYWQALKLWLKKATFYDHPKISEPSRLEKVQSSPATKESIYND